MRDVVSGGDSDRQLQLELKSFTKEDREKLLRGAGFTISVPAGQGLAMRCGVGLPWNQLRELRK